MAGVAPRIFPIHRIGDLLLDVGEGHALRSANIKKITIYHSPGDQGFISPDLDESDILINKLLNPWMNPHRAGPLIIAQVPVQAWHECFGM